MGSRRRGGFTLVEILIAMTIGIMVLGFGWALLDMATRAYHQVSGHEDGELQMKKLSRHLQRDLTGSTVAGIQVAQVPDPAGIASDAVGCLSVQAGADARGAACTKEGGEPYWQRNIVYYVARPLGDPCAGGVDADGYEDTCPHKVAVRKVIDTEDATLPLPDGDPVNDIEAPLASLAAYLTRPAANFSVAAMYGEPESVTSVEVIAVNLLSMRVRQDPTGSAPGEVQIELRTFNELGARKTVEIGTTLLSGSDKRQTHVISCFPRNRTAPEAP